MGFQTEGGVGGGKHTANTRRKDIDEGTVVGEGGPGVVFVGRADGAGRGFRGWGVKLGVVVAVSGCDGHEEACGDGVCDLEFVSLCFLGMRCWV